MAKRKPMRVRITPGLRINAVVVDDDLTVTRNWVEVSKTVAEKLVASEYQGRPTFEVEDGSVDEAESETEDESAEEAE